MSVTAPQAAMPRRGRRWRRRAALMLALLLVVPATSYVRAMSRPSNLPLGVRSVEWLRSSGFAWLVNDAERAYYTWRAPKPGGPPLARLPRAGGAAVGPTAAPTRTRRRTAVAADPIPRPIVPLIRPALPGEGVWHVTRPSHGKPSPVLVTTFRSEPTYPRLVAYVAWIDHLRARLTLNPGRYEPPSASPRGPMAVPVGLRPRLLATFNSGFTWRDGHGGFVDAGRTYEPLRSGLATLVAYRDGRVNIVSWNGGPQAGPWVSYARQNLPLIVDRGRLAPGLSDGPAWGATLGNRIRVWRSGVGVDRDGNLLYAAADAQTVTTLAQILRHAGAVRAMELDINAEWPTFISYGAAGARDPIKLVPNTMQPATRYLVPDDRDFFAVYAQAAPAPAPAP